MISTIFTCVRCDLLRLVISLVVTAGCAMAAEVSSPAKASAIEADPTRVYLVLTGGLRDLAGHVRAKGSEGPLNFTTVDALAVSSLALTQLATDGSLELQRASPARTFRSTEPGGIYLLPAWPESHLRNRDRNWLRQVALAAREFTSTELPPTLVLDRAVPFELEVDSAGRLRRLGVFAGNMTLDDVRESLVWCGDRPALHEKQSGSADRALRISYRDPAQPKNEVTLDLERREDRVVVRMSYVVNEPVDRDVPVHFRVPLAKPITSLWGVAWRFTRSRRGGTGEQPFDGANDSIHAFMSQAPMAVARMNDGSYVSVLDYDLSNLVVEAKRAAGQPDTLLVSTYLWPRERGRRYEWTFELQAGYENLYNAALRATWPFTRNNQELYQGVLAREVYNDFPSLDEPIEKGVRAIWYHRWFRRNGDYFNPAWPADRPYKTAFPQYQSYEVVRQNIERLKSRGLQVFMYSQFAGIAEDLVDTFKDSMVLDQEGKIVRAGQDGQLFNLWVNPDPAGKYGRSVLAQIAGLLDALPADGIALDRIDRMDWTYGPDQYDYGHFNGYSSVFAPRRPVASITIAGRAWLQELRKLLDARGRKLVINSSAHMYAINIADSNMMEVTDNPIALVLGKVFGNGKSVSYTVHGRMNDAMNNFIAELAQGYPYHRDRLQTGFSAEGVHAPRDFVPGRQRGRLLYAISEDGRWPTLWYFDNGHTRLHYNSREANVELRFRGSRFVPREN